MTILFSPAIILVSNFFIVPAGALTYAYGTGENVFLHVTATVQENTSISLPLKKCQTI